MGSLWELAGNIITALEDVIGPGLLWRGLCWVILFFCALSTTAGCLLGTIGMRCGQRFILMTAMGFSCCVSFWYRIYLLSATLSNRYSTSFASPLILIMMVSSNIATTIFYTCVALSCLHTFISITLHPSQYNIISASKLYVTISIVLGVCGAIFKWILASVITNNYEKGGGDNGGLFANEDLQPPPMNVDGTPWSPKSRLLWWEISPVKAKPHSYLNLFLLLIIGAGCPIFLSFVLGKMLKVRREARATLGPNARCSISRAHIFRLIVTMISIIILSVSSVTTILVDSALRGNRHLNLLVQPTPRELVLRYTFSCGTGVVLFIIYMTGDELKHTWLEYLKHCQQRQLKQPCWCRRCVKGESAYSEECSLDPITTLPLSHLNSSNDFKSSVNDNEEVDFFSALKASAGTIDYCNPKLIEKGRVKSIDSVRTSITHQARLSIESLS